MSKLLEGLNEQQLPVAKRIEGKFIVNAGAGSGKTSTIVTRTAYMIEQGIDPANILMFTFTRKAALEMKERMISKIGAIAKPVTVCTYHSFSSMLLRKFSYLIGYENNFTVCDADESEKIIKDICGSNIKLKDVAITMIGQWKTQGLTYTEAKQDKEIQANFTLAADVYEKYQHKLESENMMDFNDLTMLAARILNNYTEVQQYVWNKYKYVIVDEAQDSAVSNWYFINKIAEGNENLCMVMDNNQSIYAFRGAEIDFICKQIVDGGFDQYVLEQNYRSTSNIVNASNAVVDNNPAIIKKEAFSKQDAGTKIYVKQVNDQTAESEYVVRSIHAAVKGGLNYKDICILARTKRQFEIFEKTFLKCAIPYTLVSGLPFCNRKEIKDILAVLRLLLNNKDEEALKRIINIPKCGIGDASFNKLMLECGESSVIEKAKKNVMLLKGKAKKGAEIFLKKFDKIVKFAQENIEPALIIEYYLNEFDYKNYLIESYRSEEDKEKNDEDKTQNEAWTRQKNVDELIRIAEEYDCVSDLLESTLGFDEESVEDEERDAVSLMTIHASKGLEFDMVFIVGGNEGLFPHQNSLNDIAQIQEERRLWYVAMTRAKSILSISYFNLFKQFGQTKVLKGSRFIEEIPSEFKKESLMESKKVKVENIDNLF